MLDALVAQLRLKFKGFEFSMSAFHPKNLPRSDAAVASLDQTNFFSVCKDFLHYTQFQTYQLWNEFTTLIEKMNDSEGEFTPKWCASPSTFWLTALKAGAKLPWTPKLRYLIQSILSINQGTATVERGFSILNKIKQPDKSNLTPANLNSLMSLYVNGPYRMVTKPCSNRRCSWPWIHDWPGQSTPSSKAASSGRRPR